MISASVQKVEGGTRLVAQAGQTMTEIVGSVQRVSDIIGEIRAATSEQSQGIAQVNTAINQLDQMTQQNSALVEESAAAADSLKDQALRLSDAVQVFKLGDDAGAPSVRPAAVAPPAKRTVLPTAASAKATGIAKPVASVKSAGNKPASLAPPRAAAAAPAAKPPAGDESDWESF